MSDTDTIRWIDATGQAHIALNVPEFAAPQHVVIQQIRQYFDADAPFWKGQPLGGADLEAVDRLLRVILVNHRPQVQRDRRQYYRPESSAIVQNRCGSPQ